MFNYVKNTLSTSLDMCLEAELKNIDAGITRLGLLDLQWQGQKIGQVRYNYII